MLLTVKYVELAALFCDYKCRSKHPVGNRWQLERLKEHQCFLSLFSLAGA